MVSELFLVYVWSFTGGDFRLQQVRGMWRFLPASHGSGRLVQMVLSFTLVGASDHGCGAV